VARGLVSVIIPNWNGERFLEACLDTLAEQTYKNYEVILVDNASTDGSLALVRSRFPWVKVVPLPENRGFAAAINEGIRHSEGEYIALLNNDAQAAPQWIEELVGALDSHPEAGACASKMLRLPNAHIIDGVGDEYSHYGMAFRAGQGETDVGQYDLSKEVFGACGGAAIYRRALLEEAGLFDEDFFMYYEDVDMDFAVQLLGYKVLYVPTAIAYHVGHPNTTRDKFIQRLTTKNTINVMMKNMPLTLALRLAPRLFRGHLRRALGSIAWGWFDAHLLGWLDAIRLMPRMLAKRRARLTSRRVSNEYLRSIMKPYYPVACSVPVLPRRTEKDPESNIDLSIVIVNWNTKEALKGCLESIYASGLDSFEIIVADNASEDSSISMLEEEFPQARLIKNARNVGFARASNQGMFLSRGDHILLLNSDTQIEAQALRRIIEFMEEHPQAGAMGPRLVLPDDRPQPYSFGCDPTLGYLWRRGLNLLLRKGYLHDWGTEEIREVDWVSGASLMLRRRALEETGLLDENFFLYFEDNDLCLRLRQKGWKVYFNPMVQVIHLGGESLVKNEPARAEYYRSLLYFYSKHYGKLKTAILFMLLPLYRWLVGLRR